MFAAILSLCVPQVSQAEDAAPEDEAMIAEALQLTTTAAKQYEVKDAAGTTMQLLSDPILKWSNPVAGSIYGNVYLWVDPSGQPAAVGSFYKWFSPWTHSSHEFHSLWSQSMQAKYDGEPVWFPNTAGVRWEAGGDLPELGKSPVIQRLQLRKLAEEFTVTQIDKEQVQRHTRLLSKPVYQYSIASRGIVQGALFTFVEGTDPEAWLLIELVKQPTQGYSWRYAIARMNSVAFTANRNGRQVWEVTPYRYHSDLSATDPYFKLNYEKLLERLGRTPPPSE